MKKSETRHSSDLSPARRRLVDNIRHYRFGHFQNLRVRDRDPVWEPPPSLFVHDKYGKDQTKMSLHDGQDCKLNKGFVDLFAKFDKRKNFTIPLLEFQDGVPVSGIAKVVPV
jgi:hypothetical protein